MQDITRQRGGLEPLQGLGKVRRAHYVHRAAVTESQFVYYLPALKVHCGGSGETGR